MITPSANTAKQDGKLESLETSALPDDADPKLVASISAVGVVCTLILALHAVLTGRMFIGLSIVVVAITIAVNLLLATRRPISYLQLNVSLFIITGAMVAAILLAGSPTASAVILLSLVPFIMGALGNWRWLTVWLFVVLVLLVGFYFHAPYATAHYAEPAPDQVALHYIHVTVLGLIITVTGYVLMGKRHAYLLELESAKVRLTVARDEARAANEVKGEFLGRMSHELRPPLNAILGLSEMMAADHAARLTPAQIQRLEHIQLSGHRLLEIVDQILEITTHESRQNFMVLLPTPLAPAIAKAVNASSTAAARLGISISVDTASFKDLRVLAEQKALAQILSELVDNAVKFNFPGGTVRITVEQAQRNARISVIDSGPGLPEAAISDMFEPFSQLQPRETNRVGAGLGLTAARALAEGMNAKIEVISKENAGATFTLVIPVFRNQPTDLGDADGRSLDITTPDPSPSLTAVSLQRPTVLYIEDNQLNQLVMKAMFDEMNLGTLYIAENTDSALANAQTLLPDMLLVDLHHPGTSSVDVIAQIRACPALAAAPAIAVSAETRPEQIRAALNAGFDDFLLKPVSLNALSEALNRQLRRAHKE